MPCGGWLYNVMKAASQDGLFRPATLEAYTLDSYLAQATVLDVPKHNKNHVHVRSALLLQHHK
jgi:hypothetical protein